MQPASILIVEDESIVAMDISYQLQEMGYHVCAIADNGEEAIALAGKHHPDVVLMDIIIKGTMDGIETARHIGHRYQIPIIFLTAYSDVHTVDRAVQTAPYGYLTKPFQANELRAVIEVALYKAGLEKRLRESERWFVSTLRCIADSVVAVDAQGAVQFLNLSAEALLEWKLPEAKGRHVDEILHMKNPRTGDRLECPALRALRNDAVVGITFGTIMVSRTGFEFPIDDSAAPIRGENGQLMGAVMVFRDVSMRLKIEQELRQREEHFRKVFDFAPVGMALIGMDGAFLEMNAALCSLLGYPQGELLAMRQSVVTYPPDMENEQVYLSELLSGLTASAQFEKRYLAKNGREIWVLVSVSLLTQGDVPMCYLYQIHDLTDRKNSEHELARLAHSDVLTGLANRTRLYQEAETRIAIARRQQSGLAIIFMDLDHFKQINDSLGHEAGDSLLREVGRRLKAMVRETDCAARLGGDEFVLLLTNIHALADVSAVTSKIIAAFSRPVVLGALDVVVGVSVGISLFPEDGTDIRTLLKCADSALYHAKSKGGGNVQFYRAELMTLIEQRLALASDLRLALERHEFEIYFQPILAMDDSPSIGAEVLLRWRHPERGLMLPGQFIPLAEETGLILPIGEWMIGKACRQAIEWKRSGIPVLVSINVSPRQIRSGNLGALFQRMISDAGLDPALICLEVSEQFLLQDTERNLRLITELKDLGLKISIGDFGVGDSSLGYFERLGPCQLKIDRSFISSIIHKPEDADTVKAIIAMARSLRMQVAAEGVETEAQHDFIREEGRDRTQGYFHDHPLTAEEFRRIWLAHV